MFDPLPPPWKVKDLATPLIMANDFCRETGRSHEYFKAVQIKMKDTKAANS